MAERATAPNRAGPFLRPALRTERLGHALAGVFSLAVLLVIAVATLDEATARFGAVAAAVTIVTLTQPALRGGAWARAPWMGRLGDAAMMAGFACAGWWFYLVKAQLWTGFYVAAPTDIAAGLAGLAVLLVQAGRVWGRPLIILALGFVAFAFAGPHLPGALEHFGVDLGAFLQVTWYSFDGVFGRTTGIVADNVLIFLIFGAILERTGAAETLIRLSTALLGRVRGGAAHAAIAASAVFGMMSGSVAANIAGTGVMTIPMIRKQGFSANFAGAVEAAASSAGQLTPPIMAATVFVMADLVGLPLVMVIVAAALPALFKYIGLFAQVYVEAVRLDIRPLPRDEIPILTAQDWLKSGLVIVPVAVLMAAFMAGRSPAVAGLMGVIAALLAGLMLSPGFRRDPARIWQALCAGGISAARIMLSVAVIGLILGLVNETGIAIRFAIALSELGEAHLLPALIVAMLGAMMLGMGLPTLPAYLIMAVMVAPAIIKAGALPLAAHMFVLYFAVFSAIMPPIAYGCYIAAPIAGGDPLRMSITALRLSVAGILVPFVFVSSPSLLLVAGAFSWAELAAAVLRLLAAIWMASLALGGADPLLGRLGMVPRLVRLGIAAAAMIPLAAAWVPAVVLAPLVGWMLPRLHSPLQAGAARGGPAL